MPKANLINFRRTDKVPVYLEQYLKYFADHFKTKRNYFPDFCRFLRSSKTWEISNLNQKVIQWEKMFGKVPGRKTITDLVKNAFGACQTDEDINKLRGGIVEALVISKHGGTKILVQNNVGWGAKVYIQGIPVLYNCQQFKTPQCGNRATVDFGIWNGHHGQFYECKVSPINIACKEVEYMRKLFEELKNQQVSFEIFFVCPESEEAILVRMSDFQIKDVQYKAIGIKQLSA